MSAGGNGIRAIIFAVRKCHIEMLRKYLENFLIYLFIYLFGQFILVIHFHLHGDNYFANSIFLRCKFEKKIIYRSEKKKVQFRLAKTIAVILNLLYLKQLIECVDQQMFVTCVT